MDGKFITAPFEKIGARAKAFVVPSLRSGRLVRLDVLSDSRGSFYEIYMLPHVAVRAVDIRPDMRHLLLMAHDQANGVKHKFLCGHDERHWFVAGVPDVQGISNVQGAMEALKPPAVRMLQSRLGLKARDRTKRRTPVYIRQGEWFFIKGEPGRAGDDIVRHNEPLSRGVGSKPHIAQFAVRTGGEQVWVSSQHPGGVTKAQYAELIRRKPGLKNRDWRPARRNAAVFVRGRISHPDHATIVLDGWHQVLMNEEGKAPASRHIAFID